MLKKTLKQGVKMSFYKKTVILLIVIFASVVYVKNANSGWLDTGKNILKDLGSHTLKNPNELTVSEIAGGLKDALRVGTENVVKQIGRTDGFFKDNTIHIPLPGKLQNIKKTLDRIGMADTLKDLELKLNRAAEIATPKAKKLFWDAIASMTMEDVNKIYKGPKDAATQYFKKKMSLPLQKEMKPVIDASLNQVEAVRTYNSVLDKYNSLPFIKPINGDIATYTLGKALDGIFYYLGKEEAAFRENPAKRTTELLKRVFGR
jgi:hypothetical protein